jgi:hypothetical protein
MLERQLIKSDPTEKKYFWVLTEDETPMTPQEMLNTVLSGKLDLPEPSCVTS